MRRCLGGVAMQPGRSGRARFGCRPGLSRPGADLLSRRCRPDTERLSCRTLWLGPEERPAARTELRLVPDHADRDTVDIGNFRTAQAERVTAAGLLLVGGI